MTAIPAVIAANAAIIAANAAITAAQRAERSDASTPTVRMPAEWEPHEATWIAWPHHEPDWPGKLGPIPWVYAEIVRALAPFERVEILCHNESVREQARHALTMHEVDPATYRLHVQPSDRVWLRDSGPTGVHLADDKGKTLQRTHVGHNTDSWFAQRKLCILGTNAEIAGGYNIQPRSDALAMNGGDHRFPAFFDRVTAFEKIFLFQGNFQKSFGRFRNSSGSETHQIQSRRENSGITLEDHDPYIIFIVQTVKNISDILCQLEVKGI